MRYPILFMIFSIMLHSCINKHKKINIVQEHPQNNFSTVSKDSALLATDSGMRAKLDSEQINLIDAILPRSISFIDSIKTASIKGVLDFINADNKNIRANLFIRIYQDSIIWVSITFLGFEIARMLATPNNTFIYNKSNGKIEQTNMATLLSQENIPSLSNPFQIMQNFLLGKMLYPKVDSLQITANPTQFLLFQTLLKENISTITKLDLKGKIYYPIDIQIPQIANYIFQINYGDWNMLKENQYFPMQRNLAIYDTTNLVKPIMLATLYFSEAKFNEKISFPFPELSK